MLTHCDMCGEEIKNNECSCGEWKESTEGDCMRAALEQFHEMKKMCITGDAPHLGCAAVFFRGDYEDCMKVQDFIKKMKSRPYYKDQ